MAGSVNKVILVGNLGKDPEVRTTQAGAKIVNLTLATSENWTAQPARLLEIGVRAIAEYIRI